VPKKSKPSKPRPLYKSPPPKPERGVHAASISEKQSAPKRPKGRAPDFRHPHFLAPSHFELREDGSIALERGCVGDQPQHLPRAAADPAGTAAPRLILSSESPFVRLYHGNCLELLDAIAARYPEGRFDAIFADPPYFLSNGGITCHAGKMVKVDKGDWDVSRGPELNHEFNREWLRRCQRVLKPNGTLWVSGTHHVIFSIGYALQQLGYKILNDIAWEKPNPPPNLSCRYFTHSTETLLWAAKDGKSKHVFNYQAMRKVTGKQMKTVWRSHSFQSTVPSPQSDKRSSTVDSGPVTRDSAAPTVDSEPTPAPDNIWTIGTPASGEKQFGKHPTQKPVALVERCLLASTNENDLVLDPFLGNGTTAVAAVRLNRQCVGIELNLLNVQMAEKRVKAEIISIWLRHFRVRVEINVFGGASVLANRGSSVASPHQQQIDLAIFPDSINGSRRMADVPQIETERIFHECKFVFLSCAHVERGAVVHTTVDVSLQEAWAKTPNGKKRETTHVVRCETEIFRVNPKT
jgi:site-specific DNA-methyltransferase (adenine-specific)